MGPQGLPETAAAARLLGLELQVLPLASGEMELGFAQAERGRAQALLIMPTPFYNLPEVRRQLGALAIQHRLPSMCEELAYVHDGCLLSYGPDFAAMCAENSQGREGRRSACGTADEIQFLRKPEDSKGDRD